MIHLKRLILKHTFKIPKIVLKAICEINNIDITLCVDSEVFLVWTLLLQTTNNTLPHNKIKCDKDTLTHTHTFSDSHTHTDTHTHTALILPHPLHQINPSGLSLSRCLHVKLLPGSREQTRGSTLTGSLGVLPGAGGSPERERLWEAARSSSSVCPLIMNRSQTGAFRKPPRLLTASLSSATASVAWDLTEVCGRHGEHCKQARACCCLCGSSTSVLDRHCAKECSQLRWFPGKWSGFYEVDEAFWRLQTVTFLEGDICSVQHLHIYMHFCVSQFRNTRSRECINTQTCTKAHLSRCVEIRDHIPPSGIHSLCSSV